MIKTKRPTNASGEPMTDREMLDKVTKILRRIEQQAGLVPGDKGKTQRQ